jgi:hypothetical protein
MPWLSSLEIDAPKRGADQVIGLQIHGNGVTLN